MRRKGRIIKAVSGFYYVYSHGSPLRQCRARGIFKLQELTPLVGDYVTFSAEGDNDGIIESIDERSSQLIRPSVANIDQVILVFSLLEPPITYYQLDKMIAMIERQRLPLILVFTKADLPGADPVYDAVSVVYSALYPVLKTSVESEIGMVELGTHLFGKTSAIAGISGVGKSSLLRYLIPEAIVETGEVSKRGLRGRHTTRHVELFFWKDGYILDTPGFSQFSFSNVEPIEVQEMFRDVLTLANQCEFRGCMHESEQGCMVRDAYDKHHLPPSRYQSYLHLLAEVKQLKVRRYT